MTQDASDFTRLIATQETPAVLSAVVFQAKGARVMLTMNLWSCVGLCNGATGTVVVIIYQNNHQPPIAVMVEFENYRGPAFIESKPLCIPICPITVSSDRNRHQ